MPKMMQIFLVVIAIVFTVLSFQNCKVQSDENGSYQAVQKLPSEVEEIVLSKGFSASFEESMMYMRIDLSKNNISIHFRNPSDGSICDKDKDLNANIRASLLEKYDRAQYCIKTITAEPGVVCTLQMKAMDHISVYNNGTQIMQERIGAPNDCYSGVVMNFCQGGEEVYEYLTELMTDAVEMCKSE